MNYIVWQKEEYGDTWKRFDCESENEVQGNVLTLTRLGGEIMVTVPIQYTVRVSLSRVPAEVVPAELPKPKKVEKPVKEEVKVETTEDRPTEDKSTGGKS